MHSISKFLVILVLISISRIVCAVDFPEPKIVKINDRIHVLLGPIQHANKENQGYMVNSTVIVGDKGVILVDPGGSDEVGAYIKKQVKTITEKPVAYVIDTHSHGDHYLGNQAFPEAVIISSEECRDLVIQTGDQWIKLMEDLIGRELPNTKPVLAGEVYPPKSKTSVEINGVKMVIWVPLGSHTHGDLMIYLPEDKVLISGDILINGVPPTMQDGVVKNWIKVLEDIEQTDANVFVPGHGALMNRKQVRALRASIEKFYADVRNGYLNELSESEIRKTLDLSEWEKLERSYVIGRNINRAYLEIEQDEF